MDSSFEGFVLDPSKCSMLSMEEKRELVYQISKWSHGAPEMLQSWSRRELLQILCAEMGKERKYTGLTKVKMIEHLLKVVSEKKPVKRPNDSDYMSQPSPNNQSTSKRQRKTDNPSRLPVVTNNFSNNNGNTDTVKAIYCQNSACRATLCREDIFCKRCSCCICYQYDDNKDPSLWLVCSSEPPFQDDSCGMSCHLECALKHEKSGIAKDGQLKRLDGNFYCVSCRKLNDLLGCWRKQLIVAKDTRRVDILCYRVSLSQKLLNGTEKYQKLHEIVDTAAKKLEAEVGPIAGLPIKMVRGIVNRLSCGPEVQKLCASAVESLDSMLSRCPFTSSVCQKLQEYSLESSGLIRFENVSPTSLTVVLGSNSVSPEEIIGYTLWHRRADVMDYPAESTCTLFTPNTRFLVLDLSPATEYVYKVVAFCNTRELGMWEVRFKTNSGAAVVKNSVEERSQSPTTNSSILSNPSSEGDESNNVTAYEDQINNPTGKYNGYCMKTEIHDSSKLTDDASKNISHSRNTSRGIEKEEMPGDSVSALDEERTMGEVVSVPNIIKMDCRRDLRNSTPDNPVSEIPQLESHPPPEGQLLEEMGTVDRSKLPVKHMEVVLYEGGSDAVPITPCKIEIGKDGPGRTGRPKPINEEPENRPGKFEDTQAGSSSKKRSGGRWDKDECPKDGSLERDYEYCVKVIRWLECEGHIEKNFRVKFLSWYSLRAAPQERKVVKVFVDTLIDDPPSLAGQLIDTFSEGITSRRPPVVPPGFCMKLWH